MCCCCHHHHHHSRHHQSHHHGEPCGCGSHGELREEARHEHAQKLRQVLEELQAKVQAVEERIAALEEA